MSKIYPLLESMEQTGNEPVLALKQRAGAIVLEGSKFEPQWSCIDNIFIYLSIFLCIIFPPSICCMISIIPEYQRAVILRLGKLTGREKGPGMFCVIPCVDDIRTVDKRTKTFDVPPQEVLTKDSVTIRIDAVVYYRISDATMSVANVKNADAATHLLAQTTLRNILGTQSLAEVMQGREEISREISDILDKATDIWGIKVERVEIKDVKLPPQLQRAMAAEAEASRDAKAKVIAAEGEMNSSKKLKEAADIMSSAPNAIQLRYLQTLAAISSERNSTIMFPLPIEMMNR